METIIERESLHTVDVETSQTEDLKVDYYLVCPSSNLDDRETFFGGTSNYR